MTKLECLITVPNCFRLVMDKTDHTLLVSQGAEKLAEEEKLEKVIKFCQSFVSKSSDHKLAHEKL